MQQAFRGHMVVLCNECTASDGEDFAEGFQLEAAVKHLQERIAKEPVEVPKPPAYPDKKKE